MNRCDSWKYSPDLIDDGYVDVHDKTIFLGLCGKVCEQ